MTVCGNKLSGVCGACKYINMCRNNEIANLPKSNIEWMREASLEELAKWLAHHSRFIHECGEKQITPKTMYEEDWEWWLKQPHSEVGK